MKKIGDIMAEMGFNKNAPDSVKEAFIKHLIKATTGVEVETPSEKSAKLQSTENLKPVQLAFNFEETASAKKAV